LEQSEVLARHGRVGGGWGTLGVRRQ
jgi:hypothetical protein